MIGPLLSLILAAPSPHQDDLARHRDVAPIARPHRLYGGAAGAPRATRMVYGYYPYWVDAWDEVRWDLLTHIVYFAVEMDQRGMVTARHGWPDRGFVETAQAHGVRVDLAFTLFDGAGIRNLTCDPARRAQAVESMIDELESGGADGISVDFEGLLDGTRDCFTTFITELRTGLTERGHPAAGISIAGPAVDWTNAFDLGALAPAIDVYFIMGYGYHWGGSAKAGPNCPLHLTPDWRPHLSISMQRTLAHYTGQVSAEDRRKIVYGVPYYGQEWPTSSDAMHATTTGNGTSRTYAASRQAVEGGRTRRFDEGTQNPWYAYAQDGGWRQNWYDDEESLAAKYQLIQEQGIGGVGIWALGYDSGYAELWNVLEAYFTAEPTVLSGTRADPRRITTFPFAEDNDTRLGPSNYFNSYGCRPGLAEYGREWVYQVELCEPGTLSATVQDGAGVDVDLHLLTGPMERDCTARDDGQIEAELSPGRYYVVADSYVDDHLPQEGAFHLEVNFTPAPGSPGCLPDTPPLPTTPVVPVGQYQTATPPTPEPPVTRDPAPIEPEVEPGGCGCRTSPNTKAPIDWANLALWAAGCFTSRRLRGTRGQ